LRAQVDNIDNTYSLKAGKKRGVNEIALSNKRLKKKKSEDLRLFVQNCIATVITFTYIQYQSVNI